MRKLFLVLMLTGLLVFGVFSQMNDMMFGVKGGLTLGRINSSEPIYPDVEEKFRIGFAGGGMIIVPVAEKMYIQGEFLYVLKGEKMEDGGEEATVKMNVLEIPVLFKYMIDESIAIYGGLSLDYILTSEIETPGGTNDISEYIKNIGIGLSFGVQYKMDKILFDGRYDLGISNIYETSFGDHEMLLNTIYITAGYLF